MRSFFVVTVYGCNMLKDLMVERSRVRLSAVSVLEYHLLLDGINATRIPFSSMMGWKRTLLLLPLSLVLATSSTPTEQFDEELSIRPLRDGKVASRFSFTTVLKGVAPRDPATLGSNDECASINTFLADHFIYQQKKKPPQHNTIRYFP
jgi:hypothetical protein